MASESRGSGHRGLLTDPDLLEIPVEFPARPIPQLHEPENQTRVPVPAARDLEAMVPVRDRRIRVLSAYWHAGWEHAEIGAWIRSGVHDALCAAVESLPEPFGLAVLDAWRPLELQTEIYERTYADPSVPSGFVSPPSRDPTTPPPHLTGGTVDVTLTWNGHALELGTPFDAFEDLVHTRSFESTPGRVRELRRLLYWTMRDAGFVVLEKEWWHFELGTRRWAALTGSGVWYGAADIVLVEKPFTQRYRIVTPNSSM